MDALQAIADPVRRDIVDLLAHGDLTAGELAREIGSRHGISQPGVSRHLRVLRESGVATSTVVGQQRVYALNASAVDEVENWARDIRTFWAQRMQALDTELARGRRRRGDDDTHVAAKSTTGANTERAS
jgi:Predicted transcriptional regulators